MRDHPSIAGRAGPPANRCAGAARGRLATVISFVQIGAGRVCTERSSGRRSVSTRDAGGWSNQFNRCGAGATSRPLIYSGGARHGEGSDYPPLPA